MNFEKNFISVVFNVVCAVGAILALTGLVLSFWFLFASGQVNRFYWGLGALVAACVGYAIYLYVYPKIHKKWTDHY